MAEPPASQPQASKKEAQAESQKYPSANLPSNPSNATTPHDPRCNKRVAADESSDPQADIDILAQPLTFEFSGRTTMNRFLKAPMTERLCRWNDETKGEDVSIRGTPTPAFTRLYTRWSEGAIGIIVVGNTMISYTSVEAHGNPILADDHDDRTTAFRSISNIIKSHGSLGIVQLSHPGRQGSKYLNPDPVSASDVHLELKWAGNEFGKPRPLSVSEIKKMVDQWAESAWLCWKAGFDGVQVHCAHGYLLAQFLSPSTNLRTDEYGGAFEGRARIVFEVIEAINQRVRVGEKANGGEKFIICVKLNSVEFQERGMSSDDARKLCLGLEERRVDFVDLSGGTFEGRAFHHVKESTKKREAYFIEFAEQMRPLLKRTKVFVTGGLRTASGMAKAVREGSCDGVGLGRPLAQEPYLCREILEGRVRGAIENAVPVAMNTQASGTQLHQIGRGGEMVGQGKEGEVSDWSDEGEVKRWVEANEKETKRKIEILPLVDSSGFPPLSVEKGFRFAEVGA